MGSGRFRIKRPKDAAVAFMKNRTEIGDVTDYDGGRDVWIDRKDSERAIDRRLSLWEDSYDEVQLLFSAMEKYYAKQGVEVNVRNMKWDEAFTQIARAADQYDYENATGSKANAKHTLRRISAHVPAMKHWFILLPQDSYGSCIAGGLHMLASAAERLHNTRKAVQDVVVAIPKLLSRAKAYIDIYDEKPRDALTRAVAAFVKSIVMTLRYVVEYLTHSSHTRFAKAFVRGDEFEKRLGESIKEMQSLAEDMSSEASIASQKRIKDMTDLLEKAPTQAQVAGYYYAFLLANPKMAARLGIGDQLLLPPAQGFLSTSENEFPRQPLPGPSRKNILRALDFDSNGPAWDIQECQALQHRLNRQAKDEATHIIRSKELKRWLTKTDKSRELLVNGNRPARAMEYVSVVSTVSAELVSLFSIHKSAVVVSYFCGLHADFERGPSAWVPDMMKSLICQLLAQPKDRELTFDTSFMYEGDIERMQDNNLHKLCKVFRRLVLQLPSDKIFFCVLDTISRLEVEEEAQSDAIYAINQLVGLIRKRKKVSMKLLLTTPSHSSFAGNEETDKEVVVTDVLVVPGKVYGGSQHNLDTTELEDSMIM